MLRKINEDAYTEAEVQEFLRVNRVPLIYKDAEVWIMGRFLVTNGAVGPGLIPFVTAKGRVPFKYRSHAWYHATTWLFDVVDGLVYVNKAADTARRWPLIWPLRSVTL